MNELKNLLFSLCKADACGNVRDASEYAYEILSEYAETQKRDNLTVLARLEGASDYTLMVEAHIDEVCFDVTHVDDEGFLTVAKYGACDLRTLPAKRITIHGEEDYPGTFCSVPPYLSSGEEDYSEISDFKIDSLLGAEAKNKIHPGDFVTAKNAPVSLLTGRITAKALDDRIGVVCLLELCRRLSKRELPFHVVFAVCDAEEIGLRGAKTAAFEVLPDEAIAIDASFGECPDVSEFESGKLSSGPMIGISPVLDRRISDRLLAAAQIQELPFQVEVMAGATGTDSDVISVTANGIPTGLVSVPIRNMHTSAEIADLYDIKYTCDLLESYILSGGLTT